MSEDNTAELIEAMFQVFRMMKKEIADMGKLPHLSVLQIQALMFLYHNRKVSMSDIAAHFHIELPSATSLLNRLFDQKLVERHEDPEDRRLVRISLTGEGKALARQARTERRKRLENVLSYLSAKEKSDLLTILRTLNNRLQEIQ